jgi:transcriptional regulator with XRE-family HTH domain
MLHKALKQTRMFHQMKQIELAEKLGISKSYLSEIESGHKSISVDLIQKYAEVFSIPASSLLLFSENIGTKQASDNFRLNCASKIIKMLEWVNAQDEFNNKEA